MDNRRARAVCVLVVLALSFPFVILHWIAAPNDAAISVPQRAVAALANYAGPWGVAIVRLVDFPNAGMRSFSCILATIMTLLGAGLVLLAMKVHKRAWQTLVFVLWGLFVLVWFGVGLVQIADGLL